MIAKKTIIYVLIVVVKLNYIEKLSVGVVGFCISFHVHKFLIVWTKMANDIIGPIYRNGMNWRLRMVVDDKWYSEPVKWCIICLSIRSVRNYIAFLIVIVTITHQLLYLFLIISFNIDNIGFGTIGDDRWQYEPFE